jgi:hypothetical protein
MTLGVGHCVQSSRRRCPRIDRGLTRARRGEQTPPGASGDIDTPVYLWVSTTGTLRSLSRRWGVDSTSSMEAPPTSTNSRSRVSGIVRYDAPVDGRKPSQGSEDPSRLAAAMSREDPRRGHGPMNGILLTGRLTRDPELRTTAGGKAVAQFSVASHEYVSGTEKSEFHDKGKVPPLRAGPMRCRRGRPQAKHLLRRRRPEAHSGPPTPEGASRGRSL